MNEQILTKRYSNKVDVLIIGAGLSGLITAIKIIQKEPTLQVRILEATNTIGGQVGNSILGEIGAKWITEDQCHIYRLLTQLKVALHKRTIVAPQLQKYRELDEGLLSSLANFEVVRYVNELELKLELFKPGFVKPKEISMYKHIRRRLFFNSSRKYMLNIVLLVCGVDAKDISFTNFMSICYTSGGLKRLIDLLVEAPNYSLLEFSSKELLFKILENLKDIEILYWRKACAIKQYREHVEVRDSANEYHISETVVLAVALNCIQDINFWPPLPMELQIPPLSADSEKYIITSFLARYADGYWRLKGFSGHFIKNDPLLIGHEYRPTIYCGYIIHEEGIEPLIKSVVLHELSKVFGEKMLLPREFQQHSYDLNSLVHLPLTTPFNRIIWSSSAAAGTCYRGRLGGAVQSGLRAAMNALLVCRPQIVTWHDIAEIQCHDYIHKREATWSSILLSSCNLYNVTSYTLFICSIVFFLTKTYKKH